MSVEHYENFPVASWLCPPALRPAVRSIYWFARVADDLADEGDAPPAERHAALDAFRADLLCAAAGRPVSERWSAVFEPLAHTLASRRLPVAPLLDLLSAFQEDVDHAGYEDRAHLLRYCERSANPVGRLLLHLHGVDDPALVHRSDAVCTALQLVNFWQDLSVDVPRGRVYVPRADARAARITVDHAHAHPATPAARALVRELVDWTRALMLEGAPIALAIPGRLGWELRLVVHGGLRILEKIEAMNFESFARRPRLRGTDLLLTGWRALGMRNVARAQARPA